MMLTSGVKGWAFLALVYIFSIKKLLRLVYCLYLELEDHYLVHEKEKFGKWLRFGKSRVFLNGVKLKRHLREYAILVAEDN